MFSNQLKVMHAIDDDRADIYAQTFFFFSKAMLFFFFNATSSCTDGVGTVTVRRLS